MYVHLKWLNCPKRPIISKQVLVILGESMTNVSYDGGDDDPVDQSPFLCVLFDPDDHKVDLCDHWLGRN